MKKVILKNAQSPGDILMLTAALRDLHRCYPGEFLTDVRTSCPALWENNPHLTPLDETASGIETIDCHYPLIHQSNQRPYHFLEGFIHFLNRRLGLSIRLTDKCGDIHLSEEEQEAPSAVASWCGSEVPYWIVVAGGKWDFTIKWWDIARWQAVVDHFKGRLFFVQVGERGHYHPRLHGALDLRGRTSLRALVRLVHHTQGITCPVTCLMHLAAAVPRPASQIGARPCVVVAGGREPVTWEAYASHHFLHTIGELPCCAQGGCWRARTAPIGDGDAKDKTAALCQRPIRVAENSGSLAFAATDLESWRSSRFQPAPHFLPECMDRITAQRVIDAIEISLVTNTRLLKTKDNESMAAGISRMATLQLREQVNFRAN